MQFCQGRSKKKAKGCDKQFGTNSASLFIFRVCLIGKRRFIVCSFARAKLREKIFFGIFKSLQNIFMGGNLNYLNEPRLIASN